MLIDRSLIDLNLAYAVSFRLAMCAISIGAYDILEAPLDRLSIKKRSFVRVVYKLLISSF